MKALVRAVSPSFVEAITSQQLTGSPISYETAVQQHQTYVQVLRNILGHDNVKQLPADVRHPDCCFIEDTAVVVGQTAVVARIGASARQGEEAPVATVLQDLGYTVKHIQAPGALDGGDVLQLPNSQHILVGLSRRTNAEALQQLQDLLPSAQLHGVNVAHGLHLKSACTALDSRTMVYADNAAGRDLRSVFEQHPVFSTAHQGDDPPWQHVMVHPLCANLLLPGGKHVIMSTGCSESEKNIELLAGARGLQLHRLRFDEFAKADGALTCCSILLPPAA